MTSGDDLNKWLINFDSCFEPYSDSVICLDLSYRVQAINLATKKYLKKTHADILHKNFTTLYQSNDYNCELIQGLLSLTTSKPKATIDNCIPNQDIFDFPPLRWNIALLKNAADIPFGLILIGQLTQQLSKENYVILNQFENFINSVPSSIYWKDKNGVYLGCNNAVIQKGNLASQEDIAGKTDYDVWPEYADALRETDQEVMTTGNIIEREEIVMLKNSETLHFLTIKSPIRDHHGNIIGVIGNSIDVTELKQAKQAAETASLAKTQFLAMMSHELRIPLTGVLSVADLISKEDLSITEIKELAKIVENSAEYLLSTIDGILDFAKLESNKLEIINAEVDLQLLITEISAILGASAQRKGLKFTVNYHPAPPPAVFSDNRVLRHILTNLIGNAIKYTDKGSISIDVQTKITSAATIQLIINVNDTGIGIPANKMDFIFDRFSQVANTYIRNNSRQGTGLGLSIVKKLVDLLQGQILVKSTPNVGSTFSLTLDFNVITYSMDLKNEKNSISRG
ncbi:MAG: ATP-binding protein [Gammaproteobacteria bacterium]